MTTPIMSAEFKIRLDKKNRPCIKFKHHGNCTSLEQQVLMQFIKGVKSEGCVLKVIGDRINYKEGVNWTIYEIQILDKKNETK